MPLTSSVSVPCRATLGSLPQELLDDILSMLSPTEWMSLRLCSRSFEDISTRHLFRRIRLSLLKSHHDAFFEICRSQRLSQFVRELVWYEFDVNPLNTYEWQKLYIETPSDQELQAISPTYWTQEKNGSGAEFASGLANLFWLPEGRPVDELEGLVEPLLNRFRSSLDALPHIRALISRPMPYDTKLQTPRYCFNTGMVEGHSVIGNVGLIFLLEYTIASRHNIGSLYWTDNATSDDLTFRHLQQRHQAAFACFVKLDLCIDLRDDDKNLHDLAACLYAAKNLKELKLCYKLRWVWCTSLGFLINHQSKVNFEAEPPEQPPTLGVWRNLVSLELVDVSFNERDLLNFLCRHASTLRYLGLEDCQLVKAKTPAEEAPWKDLIEKLASSKRFMLESIKILHSSEELEDMWGRSKLVDPDKLIRFINNTGSSPFFPWISYECFCTHLPTFDDTTSESPAYFSTIEFRLDREYPSGDFVALNFPFSNRQMMVPRKPAPTITLRNKTFNLWRGLKYGEPDVLYERLVPTSYWYLERVNGRVVWWGTTEPKEGNYKTELWLFERSDGAWAYGTEPLEYFSDWGSEAGSSEDEDSEAEEGKRKEYIKETPFGPSFDKFLTHDREISINEVDIDKIP